jgi:hypothetical protein
LPDDRLGGCGAVDVAADDPRDVLLLPAHDLGDDALRQARDVEPGRRRAAQIMEVQIAIAHAGGDLRLVERTAEAIARPRTLSAVGEDRGRTLGDARQNGFKAVVQRHYGFASVLALAGRNHDRVGTDVRPRQAQQIAEPQPGMRCKIDGVGSRAIRPSRENPANNSALVSPTLSRVQAAESYARWEADRAGVEKLRDQAATKFMKSRGLIEQLAELFHEAAAVDREVSRINASSPSGSAHLETVELSARNLSSFSRSDPSVAGSTVLFGWHGKQLWPLRELIQWECTAPIFAYDPRHSADFDEQLPSSVARSAIPRQQNVKANQSASVYYVAFENFFTVQEATAGAERHINGGATLRIRLSDKTSRFAFACNAIGSF